MDQIRLNAIEVMCIIGDLPEERIREQRLLVDLALELDLEDAVVTDALEDTVDYALLVGEIRDALEEAKCRLLERAAGIVSDICLADPRVHRVTVAVRKFDSVSGLGSAEIRLVRPSD